MLGQFDCVAFSQITAVSSSAACWSSLYGCFFTVLRAVCDLVTCWLSSCFCLLWTNPLETGWPTALESQELYSWLLLPIHFLLCFSSFCCSLFPVSLAYQCIYLQVLLLFLSVTLCNQCHYPKLECDYLYVG